MSCRIHETTDDSRIGYSVSPPKEEDESTCRDESLDVSIGISENPGGEDVPDRVQDRYRENTPVREVAGVREGERYHEHGATESGNRRPGSRIQYLPIHPRLLRTVSGYAIAPYICVPTEPR